MEHEIIILKCHDCGKELKDGDEYMPYEVDRMTEIVKCKECHQKDPILRHFRQTEVCTRVVGYIRPTSQWNKGKQAEFEDRVEFTNGQVTDEIK